MGLAVLKLELRVNQSTEDNFCTFVFQAVQKSFKIVDSDRPED